MPTPLPYLPGRRGGPDKKPALLARYLPPIPEGAAASWLAAHAPGEAWVLDPFGASPHTAVEAARAGRRVLVAANNPISRFLLELAAAPPSRDELRAALAELASTRKGDERLEPHIRSLYATTCDNCRREIQVEAYLWDRGASAPYARLYQCPHCGEGGEHPATEQDAARAAQFAGGGLHRARALERVAARDDPDRQHVEEALNVYLPRAVYAIFTLINKLDGLNLSPGRRRCLEALLLHACDAANTLWPYPAGRARPRQLTIPPRFRENNLWLALEQAVELVAGDADAAGPARPVTVSLWPAALPSAGGISLFEGRLRDLGRQVQGSHALRFEPGAVLAALPRPNQAFWTLSALWAGWLWGPEAVGPFKSVLRRRRYDWAWHSAALGAALESLFPLLGPGTPFFALTGESEPGFLAAALVSAASAGFRLQGLALRGSSRAQIAWERPASPEAAPRPAGVAAPAEIAVQAARQALLARGEPAPYAKIQAAALLALEAEGLLQPEQSPEDAAPETPTPAALYTRVNAVLEEAFSYRSGFIRFGGSDKSLEAGKWWLRDEGGPLQPPLSDRVEMELVRFLIRRPGSTLEEIDQALCAAFPGLLTPDLELVQSCLDSYAREEPPGSGRWRLRPEDAPRARRKDLVAIAALMRKIATRLGFSARGRSPFSWSDAVGEVQYFGHITASAVLGEILFGPEQGPPGRGLIVLPGGRANLAAYKLEADPRLKAAAQAGWRFVKYRQLRWLAENPSLSPENFDELLNLDSLTYDEAQLRLL